jgi:hypothetical protein
LNQITYAQEKVPYKKKQRKPPSKKKKITYAASNAARELATLADRVCTWTQIRPRGHKLKVPHALQPHRVQLIETGGNEREQQLRAEHKQYEGVRGPLQLGHLSKKRELHQYRAE